ncbi:hypothetical protein ACRAWD_27665 [Caulobacter segnis]
MPVAKRPAGEGLGMASPDAEIAKLADQVWGDGARNDAGQAHAFGRGRVYGDLTAALAAEKIAPDVASRGRGRAGRPS